MKDTPELIALRKQRNEILERLRRKAPEETAALDALERAIQTVSSVKPDNEYAEFRHGLDAIVAYLKRAGKPMSRLQICDDVARGGWGGDSPRAKWLLADYIRYQLEDAKRPRLVKKRGDLIWLAKSELQEPV